MPTKHQSNCYRVLNGEKFINWCDLIFEDEENERIIKEARQKFRKVRKIKHVDGYYQLFVLE